MTVTACTTDGEPQDGSSKCTDDVVKLFVATTFSLLLSLLRCEWPRYQEAGGRKVSAGSRKFICGCIRRRSVDVTCQLIMQEVGVGHVVVEGINHPVAIMPCVGAIAVERVPVTFSESYDV